MNRSTRNNVYDLIHTAILSVVVGVALLIALAIIKWAWLVLTSYPPFVNGIMINIVTVLSLGYGTRTEVRTKHG